MAINTIPLKLDGIFMRRVACQNPSVVKGRKCKNRIESNDSSVKRVFFRFKGCHAFELDLIFFFLKYLLLQNRNNCILQTRVSPSSVISLFCAQQRVKMADIDLLTTNFPLTKTTRLLFCLCEKID